MKPCRKCGATDRYASGECRPCAAKRYIANREEILITRAANYATNRENLLAAQKVYYLANKEERAAYGVTYNASHREEKAAYDTAYSKMRREFDPAYKLTKNMRSRLHMAIKGNFKSGSAVRDLGCTIEEFKTYLEAKFLPDMTWDNWSKTGWHIDHVIPFASIDVTDREQLLPILHYTNLQPLWASDNLKKGAKI